MLGGSEQISLLQGLNCLVFNVHFDLDWVRQRCSLEFLDLGSHRGGEQESVSCFGNLSQDEVDLLLEVHG